MHGFQRNGVNIRSLSAIVAMALFAALSVGALPSTGAELVQENFDVVIYGGTPSAVAAALSVAEAGHSALIVSDRPTIGGSISNGLGATDIRTKFAVTGIAREFFHRVQGFYKDPNEWYVEPHVAEQIFRNMLQEQNVKFVTNAQLAKVTVDDNRITCIKVKWSKEYCGQVFIDASYTSDLVNAANVPTTLGPSDLYAYDEPEAQFRHLISVGIFKDFPESLVFRAMKNNPFIVKLPTIPKGGDFLTTGTPSWTYRLCLSKKHMRPLRRWSGYYNLVPSWRVLAQAIHLRPICVRDCLVHPKKNGRASLVTLVKIPNDKFDLNAGTSQITNFPIPPSYFSNPETRKSTEDELQKYLESFLYFVQHDKTVPLSDHIKMQGMGLCADEFTWNQNWPYAPYIREGRRLIGKSTLTTNQILRTRTTKESIAIGSYSLDVKSSHLLYASGAVYRDIGKFINPSVYEIPYSALVPQSGPTNVLVSLNISASPTAFGSVRMEPQFMEIGQAAGTAAAISVEKHILVARVNVSGIRARLWQSGAVTSISTLCAQLHRGERTRWQFNRTTCQPR
jgi:FAD dependent oxidoreductase